MEAAYLQGSFTALCDLPALEVLNLRVNRLVPLQILPVP